MSQKKSVVVKCHEIEGVKTRFGSEVKMLMHPEFLEMGRDVSILWVVLPPGASTGLHQHPAQAEYEYIVTGNGVLNAGDDVIPVAPFMLVLNPPGLLHNIENTGSETMYLLRFHVPSLPGAGVHGNLIGQCIAAAKKSLASTSKE